MSDITSGFASAFSFRQDKVCFSFRNYQVCFCLFFQEGLGLFLFQVQLGLLLPILSGRLRIAFAFSSRQDQDCFSLFFHVGLGLCFSFSFRLDKVCFGFSFRQDQVCFQLFFQDRDRIGFASGLYILFIQIRLDMIRSASAFHFLQYYAWFKQWQDLDVFCLFFKGQTLSGFPLCVTYID